MIIIFLIILAAICAYLIYRLCRYSIMTSNFHSIQESIKEAKEEYNQTEESYQKTKEAQNKALEEYSAFLNSIEQNRKDKEEEIQSLVEKQDNIYNQLDELKNNCFNIQEEYQKLNQEYEEKKGQLDKDIQEAQENLNILKDSFKIATETHYQELEEQEKQKFYKLSISDEELSDIQQLEKIKPILNNKVIINKLIWTNFFQKQTTDLCNRIIGTQKVCGIYKITNLLTNQCYIGKSTDISNRWKTHIKYGLGIDTPSNNKLYKNMQQDGVWNFTFQLLEECAVENIDQRESFWINFYESNITGLNTLAGNGDK